LGFGVWGFGFKGASRTLGATSHPAAPQQAHPHERAARATSPLPFELQRPEEGSTRGTALGEHCERARDGQHGNEAAGDGCARGGGGGGGRARGWGEVVAGGGEGQSDGEGGASCVACGGAARLAADHAGGAAAAEEEEGAGCHGKESLAAKSARVNIFVDWLVATFGQAALGRGAVSKP